MKKTHVRIRVQAKTARVVQRLEDITQLPHSRLIRSILLGAPVVPASHLKLWSRLARSRGNLTQLEDLIVDAPDYPGKVEHLAKLQSAQEDLRRLRRRLIGRAVDS